jgi:tetratricopeptide (TPR) repeat protein
MNEKMNKFWSNLPIIVVSFLVFTMPLIFAPFQFADFLSSKAGFFSIIFYVALFIWSIGALKADKFNLPFNILSLSIILIPITYLISGLFSGNIEVSLLGKDFGYDSVLIFSTLFILFIFVINIFQEEKKSIALKTTLFISLFLVLLFNILRILFLNYFPTFGFFFESSTNTIGQWYDLGIVSGLAIILSIVSLELFSPDKKKKIFLYGLLSIGLLSLIVIGFMVAWVILGLFSVIVFVYVFSLNKSKNKDAKLPITSLVTFLIAFIFLIAGGQINVLISQIFPTSFVEVRPSVQATNEVISGVLKSNLIFGVGPTNFNQAWVDYKPTEFNMTELWNVNFRYGYSFISSFVVMGGLLHGISWLMFFTLYLFYGFKSLFMKIKSESSRYIIVSSFITSFYMWLMCFVYVPSFVNIFLSFVLTGVFISSLYREKVLKTLEIDITKSPKAGFLYIFSVVLVLLVVTTSIWHFTVRIISQVNYRQGQIALNIGDIDLAESKIYNSLVFYPTDLKIQQLTEIGLYRLGQVINNESLSDEDRVISFRNVLSGVISNLQLAIAYDSENSENYVLLGGVFEQLINYGIEGSYQEAKAAYEKAREIDSKNPSIVLSLARLEFSNENYESARGYVSEALDLKGNYSQAAFLLSQIEKAEGNVEQAIRTLEAVAQIRPNDPLVFFQLGLLRYEDERFVGAASAFESAVALNNQYDNAIYFLGLSYDRLDRKDDAVNVFKFLFEKYPENQEIKNVLENLQSGENPYESIIDDENLTDLPIDEEIEE